MRILTGVLATFFAMGAMAQDGDVADAVRAAMAADIRTEAEVARDRNRKPVETLQFFRLESDMRVLELMPGGGWYTKLLAPVLRDEGKLYVSIFANGVRDNLIPQPGFDRVEVLDIGVDPVRTEPYGFRDLAPFSFGVTDLDLVVTFRNMHNFSESGRANMNAAVYDAMRSGGYYGVIDHSLRHMQEITRETRRRVDVVQIIKEVQAAGFELVDYSDLHYRPDDELIYEVGRASVTGNTDRFTLLFRKP